MRWFALVQGGTANKLIEGSSRWSYQAGGKEEIHAYCEGGHTDRRCRGQGEMEEEDALWSHLVKAVKPKEEDVPLRKFEYLDFLSHEHLKHSRLTLTLIYFECFTILISTIMANSLNKSKNTCLNISLLH